MKNIFLIILFCSTLFYAQTTAEVIAISDGETITVLLDGNIQKKLRFAEVDCPESVQAFGKIAKQFTSDLVFGKMILFIDTDIDRYGRTIAKVYYDGGKYLSAESIKAGFGWWYYYYSKDKYLEELENEAQNRKVGLWQDPNTIAPWEYRKQNREK